MSLSGRLWMRSQRVKPSQARETGEIRIGGNEFGLILDCQRREVRIGRKVPRGPHVQQQAKDVKTSISPRNSAWHLPGAVRWLGCKKPWKFLMQSQLDQGTNGTWRFRLDPDSEKGISPAVAKSSLVSVHSFVDRQEKSR